jgi:hypothetical protein
MGKYLQLVRFLWAIENDHSERANFYSPFFQLYWKLKNGGTSLVHN